MFSWSWPTRSSFEGKWLTILRQINFGKFWDSNIEIVTVLEALNFDFGENFSFWNGTNWPISKFRASKIVKNDSLMIRKTSKTAIIHNFTSPKFWFWSICATSHSWNLLKSEFSATRTIKMAIFQSQNLPTLISRKIWWVVKFLNFHTIQTLIWVLFFHFSGISKSYWKLPRSNYSMARIGFILRKTKSQQKWGFGQFGSSLW